MSLVLFVKEFDEDRMHSICKVVSCNDNQFRIGEQIRIDLTVDAGFGEMPEKELVGKTVSVERLQPCEFIGVGVKLCAAHGIKGDA
jgi:hypothetical protein